jgi:hypothetical protein
MAVHRRSISFMYFSGMLKALEKKPYIIKDSLKKKQGKSGFFAFIFLKPVCGMHR